MTSKNILCILIEICGHHAEGMPIAPENIEGGQSHNTHGKGGRVREKNFAYKDGATKK